MMSVCLSVCLSVHPSLKISVTTKPNGFYSSGKYPVLDRPFEEKHQIFIKLIQKQFYFDA